MGMRLLRGRAFSEADTDASEPVVIVDESAARRYWPGRDPLGRKLATINTRMRSPVPHWMKVVGVVGNVRHAGLQVPPRPQLYLPYLLGEWRDAFLVVRTQGEPMRLGSALRRQVVSTDSNAVVTDVRPMDALLAASTSLPRFRARLLGAFALLALLLTAAGIYAVMSYVVAHRTPEIGVRMALGARTGHIVTMILGRGVVLAGIGLAIGAAASLLVRRVFAGMLFETSPSDPRALLPVVGILLLVALGACWGPSRRAARLDPLVALRQDNP
jgi:predicted permease